MDVSMPCASGPASIPVLLSVFPVRMDDRQHRESVFLGSRMQLPEFKVEEIGLNWNFV